MKKFYFISLITITAACFNEQASGQNYISQSFDGSSLPSGWTNTTYTTPSSGCGSSYGCAWYRQPGSTGTPGPATHSGAGYMVYDSYNIDAGGTAELASPSMDFSVYSTGYNQVSFWMYRDIESLSFTYYDSVAIYINTSAITSGGKRLGVISRDATLSPAESATGWYQYKFQLPASYTGSSNYIIFRSYSDFGYDIYIDDVSVDHIPPCSGTPSISGVTPSGPITRCVGAVDTLVVNAGSSAGLQYQWQASRDSGTTYFDIQNDTDQFKSALALTTILYRVRVKCKISGLSSTSLPVTVFATGGGVKYAALPYSQSFEASWKDHCDSHDVPDSSWTIFPVSGNNSWRRDDEGYTYAGWTAGTEYYSPAYYDTAHSARFHSFYAPSMSRGEMDMYVDCSADTVHGKELRFYYNNYVGFDDMDVLLSVDSGLYFRTIGHLTITPHWYQYIIPFSSRSAQTVIKFIATSDFGSSIRSVDSTDLGIDKIQVLSPCTGKPTAGTINPVAPCYSANFSMSLSGTTEAADLSYRWQKSADSTTWTDIAGDTTAIANTLILTNTYFRAIVKCMVSGLSDTSAVIYAKLKPFYFCYCNPYFDTVKTTVITLDNIGNVNIVALPSNVTILNNGIATPLVNNPTATNIYSIFDTSISIPTLYLDSLYRFSVTEISKNSSLDTMPVNVYIDLNHDGDFGPGSEYVLGKYTLVGTGSATVTDTFRIPPTTQLGLTGMRVKMNLNEAVPQDPCVSWNNTIYGEYEDYLVNISYPPCTGPLNAGKVKSTVTSTCVGYPFKLTDTTHENKKIGTSWNWQLSADSITWYDIAGTMNRDTLTQLFSGNVWYRVKMICLAAADTTYSDTAHISLAPPYKCYCISYADGGKSDTSDIGGFSLNGFVVSKGGPHLNNSSAIYDRQSFAGSVIDLWADSTYAVNIYYIMHYGINANARVTLFMDFDNNHQYDIPSERVLTAATTPISYYLTSPITIPHTVVDSVITGMRLIVNNNTAPNVPSDNACGTYTSGETMDFSVMFHYAHVNVGVISKLKDFYLYPNPGNGIFKVVFNAATEVQQLQIHVNNMTGQEVLGKTFTNTKDRFETELDMSGQPAGIYFVEIEADGERMIRKLVLR